MSLPKNLTKISQLADFLHKLDAKEFDMTAIRPDCGTAVCIGGWVRVIKDDFRNIETVMSKTFNISLRDAMDICYPSYVEGYDVYRATPQQAAAMLRHYDKTKIVDWTKARDY